jgi:asparaginyl-tRNA synthetase
MNVRIADLSSHLGQTVRVRGWMNNRRGSGKILFLQLRDGSGFTQGVVGAHDVSEDLFNDIKALKIEASLIVEGVVAENPRAPGGFEVQVSKLDVVQAPELDYPISKKEHGIDFLLSNRHLWLRSRRPFHVMTVRDAIEWAIREFFKKEQFLLIDTPILTGSVGESAGELFSTQYFDHGEAYLAQTGQLYLEAAAMAFGNVYCFGPTFRAEKSKTRRHLTEFWMIEAEMAYADYQDNMDVQERMVSYIVKYVLENCRKNLEALERNIEPLEKIEGAFPRISYDEAVSMLRSDGLEIADDDDFGAEQETHLSKKYDCPLFVYGYPRKVKAFYMEPFADNPSRVRCNDLLAPEGYGEIIGASERVSNIDDLLKRIEEEKLPRDAYDWYLDLRKFGAVPHAGFGLGLERTVGWICGLAHCREASPFPRMMTRIYP